MKIKPTNYQVQVKIFIMAGRVYALIKGDHMIYHYFGAIRPVVIPKCKEVPAFVIKNVTIQGKNTKELKISKMGYKVILESIEISNWP